MYGVEFDSTDVVSWDAGHEITVTIAQIYLFDSMRIALCSSPLHYPNGIGDHPGNPCVFGEQGWRGTPGMIKNTSMWLQDDKQGAEKALKVCHSQTLRRSPAFRHGPRLCMSQVTNLMMHAAFSVVILVLCSAHSATFTIFPEPASSVLSLLPIMWPYTMAK